MGYLKEISMTLLVIIGTLIFVILTLWAVGNHTSSEKHKIKDSPLHSTRYELVCIDNVEYIFLTNGSGITPHLQKSSIPYSC